MTAGDIETLVLRVNLTDVSVACTEAELTASTFAITNSVNAVYSESSRGAMTISGDLATVDIGYSLADGCLRQEWATAADLAATAAGYNLTDYDRLAYVLPEELLSTQTCLWSGSYSNDGEQVWSLMCDRPKTVAHELGHTFGLNHAGTEDDEYGDHSDPMGGGYDDSDGPLTQFNAPHLVQTGWLSGAAVLDVTAPGTYTIEPTEIDPAEATYPQILRLDKPDTGEYYTVSFRYAIGLDANLEPAYRDHMVTIHRSGVAVGDEPPITYLLAFLWDGESFVDTVNGVTITLVSHSHQSQTAIVNIGP